MFIAEMFEAYMKVSERCPLLGWVIALIPVLWGLYMMILHLSFEGPFRDLNKRHVRGHSQYVSKKEFVEYVRSAVKPGQKIFKAFYNEGQTSYFAVKYPTAYGTMTYVLYGISGDGSEVWTEDTTYKEDNTYKWPSGDEDEI